MRPRWNFLIVFYIGQYSFPCREVEREDAMFPLNRVSGCEARAVSLALMSVRTQRAGATFISQSN